MPRKKAITPLPKLEDAKAHLDLRGGKVVSAFVLGELVDALLPIKNSEAIDLVTDAFEGLRSDLKAWSRLTGNDVNIVDPPVGGANFDRYLVRKSDDEKTKPGGDDQKAHVAIIVSSNGLLDLVSPLGFALAAVTSGMDVSLYFQGPGVRALKKNFKGRMPGIWAPISALVRRGMSDVGHEPPAQKIRQLHRLGAKIYVCHPSMDAFGVKLKDLEFPDDVVLSEYVTFLETANKATIQLYP